MRKFFRLILAPLSWLLHACSPLGKPVDIDVSDNFYYDKSETDVIYSSMGNWFELGKTPMNADAETFEVLNAHLGRDKNQAYYKWHPIPNEQIDLKSFDASYSDWMWHIGMDKGNVYAFGDDVINGEWQLVMNIIEGADPETFKNIDHLWSKDSSNYFYNHKMIKVSYESFEVINDTFSKDLDSVYLYYQDRFESVGSGLKGFKKIDRYYAMDTEMVYYFQDYINGEKSEVLIKIPYSNPATIEVAEENYLLVDESVYYRGLLVDDVNMNKLEVISRDLIKDDNSVFYGYIPIDGADPTTFKWDEDNFQYKDKHRLYTYDELERRTSSVKSEATIN